MSNNKWQTPLECRLGQTFVLLPDHPKYKFCCVIKFDIYETNLETDFILDAPADAAVSFNPKGKWATVNELYGCYLKAIEEINKDLIKQAVKNQIDVDITIKPAPLETLKVAIEKAIQDSFNINYNEEDLR